MRSSASSPRPDLIQRCINWQLARRQRGTHKVKNRAEINRTGKKIYRQKGTGGARHGSARANLFRGGGRSFGPVVRSHAIELPKKVRALALRHALSAKAQDGGIVVLERATVADGKTKVAARAFRHARPDQRADHRRHRDRREFPPGGTQHPGHRRAAGAGHQRLRHSAAAQAGAHPGRPRCAGGAIQMSPDPRHYDVILVAGHHREGDDRFGTQPGDFQRRPQGDQAADQGGGGEAVRRQGEERQHADPQGQGQGLQRLQGRAVGRQEGDRDPRRGPPHRRDDGPVGRGNAPWHSRPTSPSRRASASWSWSIAPASTRASR